MPTRIIGVVRDSRFRSIREPIDPIMFLDSTDTGAASAAPLRRRAIRRARCSRVEQAWKRLAPDVPFDGVFSEDTGRRALRRRRQARAKVFAGFAPARGDRRLPRPVRPRRLHRRAADQGDRHPQGARRAHPRHRPAARLAILQAGDHRQSDRLAGRLVGDARLAERLRRADRPRAAAVRVAGAARAGDRDRHHRRPRLQGGAGQSDPRACDTNEDDRSERGRQADVAQLSDRRASGRWPRTGPMRSSTSSASRSASPPA